MKVYKEENLYITYGTKGIFPLGCFTLFTLYFLYNVVLDFQNPLYNMY